MSSEPLRFVDILTNASAVANYIGEIDVTPQHLISAIAILRGEQTMEDLGRPRPPIGQRASGERGATGAVRGIVQRWYEALGSDPAAELDEAATERFLSDLRAADDPGSG